MLEVLLGGVAAFLFIGSTRGVARKLGSRRFEPVVYALGLVVAALIYLGFSLFTPGSPWLWIEIGGVVIFGALAAAGRIHALWLAAGWAVHVSWDVWLHRGEPFVPSWYPLVCVGFDLAMALYIAGSARLWKR